MKKFLITLLMIFAMPAMAAETLNLYSWANYFPDKFLRQFTKDTGIRVNLSTFDSNEELYAKLKSLDGRANYDLILPTTYIIPLLITNDLIEKFDRKRIKEFGEIDPFFKSKLSEQLRNYCIPMFWSSTAIVMNSKYHQNVNSWKDFWNKKYYHQLLLLDDMREVFGVALLKLGYSINETNPEHIKQAYEQLIDLIPNIKLYNTDAIQPIYQDEDATIGMTWSTDIYFAMQNNSNLQYIYPKEGFSIGLDTLVIAKNAPHRDAAYIFINYVMNAKHNAELVSQSKVATANIAAKQYLPTEIRESKVLYPSKDVLKHAELLSDVGDARKIYAHYWERLKLR